MPASTLTLSVLDETLAICRLDRDASIPEWALGSSFCSITRTPDELSLVCLETTVPDEVAASRGWRCIRVDGTLDFSLTGILAGLARPLADAGISIFAVSTYDTDYLLVEATNLARSVVVLEGSGYVVRR